MQAAWLVQKTNSDYVSYLAREAEISEPLAQILINRGIKSPDEVRAFLSDEAAEMSDPTQMLGINETIAAIEEVRAEGGKVFIHGDYDTDGVTSTAILAHALDRLGIGYVYFIPNRFDHGYGFNPPAVQMALEAGATLVITVDCGISSFEACRLAHEKGLRVIITDHHEPVTDPSTGEPIIPKEALAVVNPKLDAMSGAPMAGLAMLAGAGVSFKLADALARRYPELIDSSEFLDLATLGTLADSVPLTGENRLIAREGLKRIHAGTRPGIAALKEVSGINGRPVRAGRLAFTLVPRMNAAGRLADATDVVRLLMSPSDEEAMRIARWLDRINQDRQRIEEEVHREAIALLEAKKPGAAVVLASVGWHEGVLGIVASRIADRYMRPTFVLSIRDGIAKGSARSIKSLNIYECVSECQDLLIAFGGHKQAAGLSLREEDVPAFEARIGEIVGARAMDTQPTIRIDAALSLRDVSFKLVQEIGLLEPFGFGNPEPVLGTRSLEVVSPRIVGKDHLKMKLRSKGVTVDSIGFNLGSELDTVMNTALVDAAYTATINEWEDRRTLQLNLKAIRPSEEVI